MTLDLGGHSRPLRVKSKLWTYLTWHLWFLHQIFSSVLCSNARLQSFWFFTLDIRLRALKEESVRITMPKTPSLSITSSIYSSSRVNMCRVAVASDSLQAKKSFIIDLLRSSKERIFELGACSQVRDCQYCLIPELFVHKARVSTLTPYQNKHKMLIAQSLVSPQKWRTAEFYSPFSTCMHLLWSQSIVSKKLIN